MNSMEVQKTLKDYILSNPNFDTPQDLDPDDNLLETGVLDSLGIAEITEFIEQTFKIEIDEEEIAAENYRSLNCLTRFCQTKLNIAV